MMVLSKDTDPDMEPFLNDPAFVQEAGKLHKLAISFSLITNTKILLNTEQKVGQINCLHGMRFLSMSWVMLGHTLVFTLFNVDNIKFNARYLLDHWEFQAVANATFSVDTFFFLSGLLVAYLGIRELHKREGKMNVLLMYLYRYMRLTPPYAFCILFIVSIFPMLGEGPQWIVSTEGLKN
uniref:Acyltransferase 3 domain-containing protein n=1 Tax=Ciona savignyi TaxID=51511 RepID=H2Y934_CIOSA